MKYLILGDILTKPQMHELEKVYLEAKEMRTSPHDAICAILRPIMPNIDEATGQENDLNYVAYAVEYALGRGPKLPDNPKEE